MWSFGGCFQLVALRMRSKYGKELEIVVLRHELAILRRQTTRPAMTTVDRLFLAVTLRDFLLSPPPCFSN